MSITIHGGRDPSVKFDTGAYLTAYPHVAAAGMNPLAHYLGFGAYEGRVTFADGVWG
jgi:serralysin